MQRIHEPPVGDIVRVKPVPYAPRAWSPDAWVFLDVAGDAWYYCHTERDARLAAFLSGGELFKRNKGMTLVMTEDEAPLGLIGQDRDFA